MGQELYLVQPVFRQALDECGRPSFQLLQNRNGEPRPVLLFYAFDVLYREGRTHPKMMSVGLHMRLAGRPGRAAALARFLDYVQGHDRVWVCRRIDIARHWIDHHPYRAR